MIAAIFTTLLLAHLGGFTTTSAQSLTLTGNDKTYSFDETNSGVVLTGDNCILNINKNTELITVTGNYNVVNIVDNAGSVTITGNDGRLQVSNDESALSKYKIVGNGNCAHIPKSQINTEVIGNYNKIMIQNNLAPMTYTGDYADVFMGKESTKKDVMFIGIVDNLTIVDTVDSCN